MSSLDPAETNSAPAPQRGIFCVPTQRVGKTELVVLITPRVVKSKLDGRLVTDEFKRKLTGIYEEEAETGEEI